jgi:hypothetical protein
MDTQAADIHVSLSRSCYMSFTVCVAWCGEEAHCADRKPEEFSLGLEDVLIFSSVDQLQ